MIKKYNKLVRDHIPAIIEASGKTCVTEVLSDEDYLRMVDAKLDEELAGYHKDQNIEELAFSATLPVSSGNLVRRSMSMRWLSVPPETSL